MGSRWCITHSPGAGARCRCYAASRVGPQQSGLQRHLLPFDRVAFVGDIECRRFWTSAPMIEGLRNVVHPLRDLSHSERKVVSVSSIKFRMEPSYLINQG